MPTLDEILGRQPLKDRIATLEERLESLEGQLAGEQERRRTAVRDRQEAEERVNQLNDRIAGLEGELNRLRTPDDEETWRYVERIPHTEIDPLLLELESVCTDTESAFSACIHEEVDETVKQVVADSWVLLDRVRPCLVFWDDYGLIRLAVDAPRLPDSFATWSDRFRIEREWVLPPESGSFAIARADLFGIGSYDESGLTYIDGFESDVMGRHAKGGFSQARFERRRREQIETHLDECRELLASTAIEPLDLVGDRRIVSRLSDFAAHTSSVDATGAPESALREAFFEFWTSRIYLP